MKQSILFHESFPPPPHPPPKKKKKENLSVCRPSSLSLTPFPLVSLLFSLFLSNPSPHALLHWLLPSQQQSRNWKTEGRASGWQVVKRGSIKKKMENTKKKRTRLKQKDRMIAVAQKKEQDKAGGWERAAASQLRSDMTERERERWGE